MSAMIPAACVTKKKIRPMKPNPVTIPAALVIKAINPAEYSLLFVAGGANG